MGNKKRRSESMFTDEWNSKLTAREGMIFFAGLALGITLGLLWGWNYIKAVIQ